MKKLNITILLVILLASCQSTNQDTQDEQNSQTTAVPDFLWENATVYFMLTDRFNNANPENDLCFERKDDGAKLRSFRGGDIQGITQKIKDGYFERLGVNVIWFTPPFEQVKGYVDEGTGKTYAFHGYWPRDWTNLDPNFGTFEDLKTMVDLAHEKGIRILLDVIINHTGPVTSQDSQWPDEWVRTSPKCAYQDYETTITCTLVENLPDIRTESNEEVEVPEFLKEKWQKEDRLEQEIQELNEFFVKTNYPRAPRFYLIKWLVDYVRELGIDGFRVDTAKHIEPDVWAILYKEASKALKTWKNKNPSKKPDDLDFYMVGEVYNYGIQSGVNYTYEEDTTVNFFEQGFKALINFSFKEDAKKEPESLFKEYSDLLNQDDFSNYSVLNYISSHDDDSPFDINREKTLEAGTKLLLTPGAVQIYYGDETGRVLQVKGAEGDANLRSPMNWDELEKNTEINGISTSDILAHWSKISLFRKAHPAVGAGVHEMISKEPYIFKRTLNKDNFQDRALVVMGKNITSIDVSGVFEDGVKLKDYYSGKTAEVENGKVNFDTDMDLILIAK